MWIITHIHTGNKFYLVSEVKKCIVGRVGSDIVLSDDTSISRSHAMFHMTDDGLKLEDMGSKYGTYYNDHIETKTKLPKAKPIELKEGDRVLFGALKNEWLISKYNINTMVSSLDVQQRNEVRNQLILLGGNILSKWEPKCTHLTMSEITITIKVLHALIEKIPIVSCEYWKDYRKHLKETKQPPKVSLYLPERSSALSSAIDAASFSFNDKRKTLFAGKTFVFMSKKHSDMYSQIVEKAGGKYKDLRKGINKSYLVQNDVVVIQYVASTQSQGSQTIDSISEFLEASCLRTIPEYEIGLAIVCCTTEKYCNPSYSPVSSVLSNLKDRTPNIGTILAENTRPQTSQFDTIEFCNIEIPDSDCVSARKVPTRPVNSEIFESDVITIQSSEKPEDCLLKTSGCDSVKDNKRKRDNSDENSSDMQSSKKPNISDKDNFSENLVLSSDIISIQNQTIQPSAPVKTKEPNKAVDKRKRKTADINDDFQFAKKVHISPPESGNITETPNKLFDDSEDASSSPLHSKLGKKPKAIENKNKSFKPLPITVRAHNKSTPKSNSKYTGFLETSQISRTHREAMPQTSATDQQPESRSVNLKQGRIAKITDNDSDDEDDIFNFGSSPQKPKGSCYNSDEDLFDFGSKPSQDTVDNTDCNKEEALPQTQAFIPINKSSFTKKPTIRILPSKSVSSEVWLSKLCMLKIKSELNDVKKEEGDVNTAKRNEWIDSIKGGFEVRVRKMNLSSKGSNCSTMQDASNSTLNTSKKNFKAFVKKHNYKPQTHIVRTVPMVVPPMLIC